MARRALGPATLRVVQAVEAALTSDDRALTVACSGGADSLALAVGVRHVLLRRGLPGSAVVVDHQLQPGSAVTADRARQQLAAVGYADVVVLPVRVDLTAGDGLEAAARTARYRALDAEGVRRAATVLLGHTLDDQAETVLLGLARGSGPRSLAGMARRSGRLLRPLLGLRRAVTEEVCAEAGLEPWQDPHNADDRFARARTRGRVLPLLETELGPGVAEALARTAELARDDADLLDELAVQAHPASETLDCALLLGTPAALRRRVIRRWLLARGAPEVGYAHVLAVEDLVVRWHGQQAAQLPGVRVRRVAGRLVGDPGAGVAG